MASKRLLILISGIILIVEGAILYFLKYPYYYYFGYVVGWWFVFDTISSSLKNQTTLDLILQKKYRTFIELYIFMFFLGVAIEGIGRLVLNLWQYPYMNQIIVNTVGQIFYPAILFSFRETYRIFFKVTNNLLFAVGLSMFIGILLWEVPNVFYYSWIYNIPYIKFEIFHINIIIILGWSILIVFPTIIYNVVVHKKIAL